MKKTFNSEAAAAVHEMAVGLFSNDLLPESTMREIDELCLAPAEAIVPEAMESPAENGQQEVERAVA